MEHKQNNTGAFSTHVDDQKHSFSFVAHVACIFDSWKWRCCTELTQLFLPHCLTHMFCLHSQPSTHWLVRKYQEEELWIVILSLFLCVFSAGYSREVIGIRRGSDQFIGCWCCLVKYPAFFLQLKQVLVPRGSPGPLRHGAEPPGLRHRQRTPPTPGASLGSHTPATHRGSATRPLPPGHGLLCANRVARNGQALLSTT